MCACGMYVRVVSVLLLYNRVIHIFKGICMSVFCVSIRGVLCEALGTYCMDLRHKYH